MIVNPDIEAYQEQLAGRHDEPMLLSMEAHAKEHGFPIVGRLCGLALEVLARTSGARRVFELGSGFGYSAWWFLRAGVSEIHCTDGDAANEAKARDNLGASWDRVSWHVGDALTSFASVDGMFDIVYNDVNKDGYPDCWRAAKDRIRPGGLYICDNTLWSARVLDAEPDEWTKAIKEHNDLVASDGDFVSVIVPTRDGLLVAVRR